MKTPSLFIITLLVAISNSFSEVSVKTFPYDIAHGVKSFKNHQDMVTIYCKYPNGAIQTINILSTEVANALQKENKKEVTVTMDSREEPPSLEFTKIGSLSWQSVMEKSEGCWLGSLK